MWSGPRPIPASISALLHGAVLGWVALGSPVTDAPEPKPRSVYDQLIAGHEKKIVWYAFRDKLPDVSPLERHGVSQPPLAEAEARQTIVARAPQAPRTKQMIWLPAPPVELKQDVPSPNLLAVAPRIELPSPPPKPRLFAPPAEPKPAPPPLPQVPAAPQVRAAVNPNAPPVAVAPPAKPEPRKFIAPEGKPRSPARPSDLPAPPQLPAVNPAPKLALAGETALPARPEPRRFVAPREQVREAGPGAPLPAPPPVEVAVNAPPLPVPAGETALPARPAPRRFIAPQTGRGARAASAPAVLEAAPEIASHPPEGSIAAAVIGLNPASRAEITLPEGARPGRLAGGPVKRDAGGDGEPVEGARIFVPDLMIRNGRSETSQPPVLVARSATSAENLRQALRSGLPAASVTASAPVGRPLATPLSSAPDPRLSGRPVYGMSVQLPNVTSYTGSWLIWFAERDRAAQARAGLLAPVPLHKVDPKYVPAAMEERVEGKVRLAGIIRRDGHVDDITVVQHLDERLDATAQEALSKWEFAPAMRGGAAVDVDAVFEIPFRLAPKNTK